MTTTPTWLEPGSICPPELRAEAKAVEDAFDDYFQEHPIEPLLERAIAVLAECERLVAAAVVAVGDLFGDDGPDVELDASDAVAHMIGAASGVDSLRDSMRVYSRLLHPEDGVVAGRVKALLSGEAAG